MIPQARPLFALVAVILLLVFFLVGPFTAKPAPAKQISNADARLARWIEVVSPPGKSYRSAHAYASSPPHQPIRDQSKPMTPINLYPLGKPGTNSEEYLNAKKRGKMGTNGVDGQGATSSSLQMQNPVDLKYPAEAGSRPGNGRQSQYGSQTGKKPAAAGLSPLDRLPPVDVPAAANTVAAQKATTETSSFNEDSLAVTSSTVAPETTQKNQAPSISSPINTPSSGSSTEAVKAEIHAKNSATAPIAPAHALQGIPSSSSEQFGTGQASSGGDVNMNNAPILNDEALTKSSAKVNTLGIGKPSTLKTSAKKKATGLGDTAVGGSKSPPLALVDASGSGKDSATSMENDHQTAVAAGNAAPVKPRVAAKALKAPGKVDRVDSLGPLQAPGVPVPRMLETKDQSGAGVALDAKPAVL